MAESKTVVVVPLSNELFHVGDPMQNGADQGRIVEHRQWDRNGA